MKCSEARQIINLLLDGEQSPQAEEAQAHVRECRSCIEWQSSMNCALNLISMPELPEIDLAPAIMARLPEHHPASQLHKQRIPSRALAWIAACWAGGMLAVLAIGLLVYHLLTPGWAQVAVIRALDFIRTGGYVVRYAGSTVKVLFEAIYHVFAYQGITSRGLSAFAVWSVLLYCVLLMGLLAMLHKKKRTPGLFIVLS